MNGSMPVMGGLGGLPGLGAGAGGSQAGGNQAGNPNDLASLLNSAHPAGFSVLLSAVMLLLCLAFSSHAL